MKTTTQFHRAAARAGALLCFVLVGCVQVASDPPVGFTTGSATGDAGVYSPPVNPPMGSIAVPSGNQGSASYADASAAVVVVDAGSPSFDAGAGRPGPATDAGNTPTIKDAGSRGANEAGSATAKVYRRFSPDSPWNTPIAGNPATALDSAALIADLAASSQWSYLSINIDNYSIPVYYVDSSTPIARMQATIIGGQGFSSGQVMLPIPRGATPAQGTDKHLCIVNRQTHQEWGFWDTNQQSDGSWTCSVGAGVDLSGTGVRPPKKVAQPWTVAVGARACGFPLSAGLINVDEIRAGAIEHALVIAYPHIRSHYYTPPASTAQGTTDLALPTRGIPCGGRVQLDPSVAVESLGLSRSGVIIARALQKYGAFVGDFAGAITLYADASPDALSVWHGGLLSTLEVKDKIDLSKLRVLAIGTTYEDDN